MLLLKKRTVNKHKKKNKKFYYFKRGRLVALAYLRLYQEAWGFLKDVYALSDMSLRRFNHILAWVRPTQSPNVNTSRKKIRVHLQT